MTVRFSAEQAQILAAWTDFSILAYLQIRYGASWRWYWLNWEQNQELLF